MPARSIEQIRNLCKRRGFIFPGSAAYGGLGSFWDYGPLGVEMLHHIKRAWWRSTVYEREDMEGLDSAIIMSRKVWQKSGHEGTFQDPMRPCKHCRRNIRADHWQPLIDDSIWTLSFRKFIFQVTNPLANRDAELAGAVGSEFARLPNLKDYRDWAEGPGKSVAPGLALVRNPEVTLSWLAERTPPGGAALDYYDLLRFFATEQLNVTGLIDPCPFCGGELLPPRMFNLMFVSHTGPVVADAGTEEELASRVYLRPETAQGIFMNFKHVQTSLRRKVPFGVAQIGKAFRNEITPGNFIFRTREFEQMEIEFFIKPPQFVKDGEKTDEQWHEEWISQRYNWWLGLGVDPSRLRKRAQDKAELAHYAKATTDLEYLFPDFGWGEVEGVANRTDFDLSAHSRDVPAADLARLKLEKNADSTETFDYFDPEAKARYIPWVIEPSAGVTRAMLTFLCEAYHEELVKEPDAAEVEPLKVEIDAVIKNADKKKKEAEKEADLTKRKHDPEAITAFTAALGEMAVRLPASLLEVDNLLEEHPGAANLEPVKKLKPKVNKLAEDCVRVVLRLHPTLAPVKVAIFPLKKNAPEIVDIAHRVAKQLSPFMRVQYDDSAGIGRLYRRQDEIGTPFCITVDFETLENNTVTLRERDSMQQSRVKIDELKHLLMQRLHLA